MCWVWARHRDRVPLWLATLLAVLLASVAETSNGVSCRPLTRLHGRFHRRRLGDSGACSLSSCLGGAAAAGEFSCGPAYRGPPITARRAPGDDPAVNARLARAHAHLVGVPLLAERSHCAFRLVIQAALRIRAIRDRPLPTSVSDLSTWPLSPPLRQATCAGLCAKSGLSRSDALL